MPDVIDSAMVRAAPTNLLVEWIILYRMATVVSKELARLYTLAVAELNRRMPVPTEGRGDA